MAGKHASVCWNSVPCEILGLITEKLTDIRDYARLRSVCRHWHSAKLADFAHPQQVPLLILPSKCTDPTILFLDFMDHRVYKLYLPEAQEKLLYGSSSGWLVMLDLQGSAISLLNPIKRDKTIRLPPLPKGFPSACSCSAYKGDDIWSQVDYNLKGGDMAFYREKLYLVNRDGRLKYLDAASSRITGVPIEYEDDRPAPPRDWTPNVRVHLVEAAGDLLLLEWRVEESTTYTYPGYLPEDIVKGVTIYKLYKPNEKTSNMYWTKVKQGIGNQTLYANILQCISVSDLPGDRDAAGANHIYFFMGPLAEQCEVFKVDAGDVEIRGNSKLNHCTWPKEVDLKRGFTWLVPSLR